MCLRWILSGVIILEDDCTDHKKECQAPTLAFISKHWNEEIFEYSEGNVHRKVTDDKDANEHRDGRRTSGAGPKKRWSMKD